MGLSENEAGHPNSGWDYHHVSKNSQNPMANIGWSAFSLWKWPPLTGLIYRMFEQTQFAYEMGELENGERIVT